MGRESVRIGRRVFYAPTAAEATAGGGIGPWPADVTAVRADGAVSLTAYKPDGLSLTKVGLPRSAYALTSRARRRSQLGRDVFYLPRHRESEAGGGGVLWNAIITKVNADGTATLVVKRADGVLVPRSSVRIGSERGCYTVDPAQEPLPFLGRSPRFALTFNGGGDIVRHGTGVAKAFAIGATELTVEGWFYQYDADDDRAFFSIQDAQGQSQWFRARTATADPTALIAFASVTGANETTRFCSTVTGVWTAVAWHHIALVFKFQLADPTLRCEWWIDGVQVGVTFSVPNLPTVLPTSVTPIFNVGSMTGLTDTSSWNGEARDICAYTVALTGAEIAQRIAGTKVTRGLVMHAPYDDGRGLTARDVVRENHGTLNTISTQGGAPPLPGPEWVPRFAQGPTRSRGFGKTYVMPTGDSNTKGSGNVVALGAYRDRFFDLMMLAGFDVEMRGPEILSDPLITGFDNHHNGIGGILLEEHITTIAANMTTYLPTSLGASALRIVPIMMGTTHVSSQVELAPAIAAKLRQLVRLAEATQPGAWYPIITIIPRTPAQDALDITTTYNNLLRSEVVPELQRWNRRVLFVDAVKRQHVRDLDGDGVHAGRCCEAKIARSLFEVLIAQPEIAAFADPQMLRRMLVIQ